MPPILQRQAALVGHLEIDLVDQRRGIERLAPAIPAQVVARDPAQLVVDQRHQPIERAPIPTLQCMQKPGHISLVGHNAMLPVHPSHPYLRNPTSNPAKGPTQNARPRLIHPDSTLTQVD